MEIDQATLNAPEVDASAAPEPSMADTMQATLKGIRERDTAPAPDASAEPVAVDRPRAPDGKFAKAEVVAPAVAPVTAPVAPQDTLAPVEPVVEPVAPAASVAPPSSWTAAAKAEFAKASPVVQQEVLRREQQMHDGIAQYKEKATYAETLHKAIAPFEQTIRGLGVTPDVAIHSLLNADHRMRYGAPNDKAGMLQQIVKDYRIDPSMAIQAIAQLANLDLSQMQVEPQAKIDPNLQYVQQELQTTKQQLNQFLTAQQQREQAELNSQIAQAKQGKEHFDSVRNEMAALLQAGTAKSIDEAYEMAVWARPDLRQALLAKQLEEKLAAENQKRAEEAKKTQAAAQAAKAAAATNVAKRGTLPAQKAVGTMQDTMRETLEQIRSR